MRNEEMNWTENDIENEIELISLEALMITEIEETDWEGIPESLLYQNQEIIPEEEILIRLNKKDYNHW